MAEDVSWSARLGVAKRYGVEWFASLLCAGAGFLVEQLWNYAQPEIPKSVDRWLQVIATTILLAVVFAHKGAISWKSETPGERLDKALNRAVRYVAQLLLFVALFRAMS